MKRIAALIGAIGMSVFMSGPALANSRVATSPIAGATIKVAPSAVTISVEITPMDMGNEITVTDPAGRRVDDGTLTVAGNDIVIGMKPITDSGTYKVSETTCTINEPIAKACEPLEAEWLANIGAITATKDKRRSALVAATVRTRVTSRQTISARQSWVNMYLPRSI